MPQRGDVIAGRFRLDELVAEGGMGRVYRATELASLGGSIRAVRPAAIKLVHPALAAEPSFVAHFERETETAAGLQHPNVVPVFGVGEHAGSPFIAMAWIEGDDLGTLLARRGPMSASAAARLLWPIADALDAAHERGLVHCDVKPGNILVSRRGDVYLADFGLAVPVAALHAMPASRTVMGSASSMAPELVRRDPIEPALAGRVDVYGLACTLYACLTGGPPFRGSAESVLQAHAYAPPPGIAGHRPDLPRQIEAIVRRALDKDPAVRPASCRTLLTELTVAATRPVAETRPAPVAPRAGRPVPARRRRPSLLRAAVALAVLWAALLALQRPTAGSGVARTADGGSDPDATAALLAQVPAAADCEPAEIGDRAVAALTCVLDGAVDAGYALYEDVESLRDDWAERVEEAGFEPDSTLGCQTGEGETAWHLPSAPLLNPGRILCYGDESEGTTIEWTDERHLVRGFVVSVGDMDAAREVWRRAFLA